MLRKILLSAAVVLLLSTGALAGIGQVQGFSIDALNKVRADNAFGFASGRNFLAFGQAQMKHDVCIGSASMNQGGVLAQNAHACGMGGQNLVKQTISAGGMQGQLATGGRFGRGLRTQGQCLTLNLNTNASKKGGGFGSVGGVQSFAGGQNQMQSSRGGFSMNSQFTCAEQSVKIIGGGMCPGSNVTVNNNLDVKMFQGSMAR